MEFCYYYRFPVLIMLGYSAPPPQNCSEPSILSFMQDYENHYTVYVYAFHTSAFLRPRASHYQCRVHYLQGNLVGFSANILLFCILYVSFLIFKFREWSTHMHPTRTCLDPHKYSPGPICFTFCHTMLFSVAGLRQHALMDEQQYYFVPFMR